MTKALAVILIISGLAASGALAYRYVSNARMNALLVSELEAIIEVQRDRIDLHNAEIEKRDKQSMSDRAYYASLKREIEKFKQFANAAPVISGNGCLNENFDPVVADDFVGVHNDATSRLR
ncbi:MAG: hypothetical protein LBE32_00440 [Burkholderiales bacterium]|jgi:hypothetical protein|nr:hypothetical protein [Burkholderiales bacterium]